MGTKQAEAAKSAPPRYLFLDGLRGLAALCVMLSHAFLICVYEVVNGQRVTHISPRILRWTTILTLGHYAVAVFIVLSGYCLMLPVAKRGHLAGGIRAYLVRRARRILPPYYAALGFALGILAVFHRYGHVASPQLQSEWLQNFSRGDILSHIFLVHDFSRVWSGMIDGPMWSIAPEWQIYFLLPLLLLPLWRRLGMVLIVLTGFVLGLAPHFLLPPNQGFGWACPWYLGLFTLGMAGAVASQNQHDIRLPWWIARLACGVFLLTLIFAPHLLSAEAGLYWLFDCVIGSMTACLIVCCAAAAATDHPRHGLLRLFESRWVVRVGTFSYSLYLIHYLVLTKLNALLLVLHWGYAAKLVLMYLFGVPLALLCAYVFHLLFERPFMLGHPQNTRQAAQSAAVSPSP